MPTLHHTLDLGGSYLRARVIASSSAASAVGRSPAAIAASREVRYHLTSAGIDRLREHGCFDEGDYIPPDLFRELLRRGEASEPRRATGSNSIGSSLPRLFPEPQPPCWMLPRRRTILGL